MQDINPIVNAINDLNALISTTPDTNAMLPAMSRLQQAIISTQ